MARYLGTRVALGVVTVLCVVLLTFILMFVVPGDPARTIAGPRATPQVLALVRSNLHLNQSVVSQLGSYLVGMLHGDLGVSYVQDQPVSSLIIGRLPATIELGLAGLFLELVLGGTLGVWDGLRAKRSRVLAVINVGFLSVPAFSLAFLLLLLFGYELNWFPIDGGTGGTRIVLPALTMAGLDFAILLSGVVFVETVFGWPGIGQLQTQAFYNVDRPVLMGTVVVAAVLVVVATLAIDLLRMLIDPRTRLGAR